MFEALVILNLQYFKRDSYIFKPMSGLTVFGGRQKFVCGYPPSGVLGVKIQERHFGVYFFEHILSFRVSDYMKVFLKKGFREIKCFMDMYKEVEASTFASASSFYVFLSIIPLVALLFTIIPYTPLTQEMVINFMVKALPPTFDTFIESVVVQVYGQGLIMLIISALILLWSAGKGMQAITRGLNSVNGVRNEKRNFFLLRAEGCLYTLVFIIFLVVTFLLLVAGKWLVDRLSVHFNINLTLYQNLLDYRYLFEWILLALFFSVMYAWVPYKKSLPHKMWKGALFSGVSWTLFSWGFSFYLDNFNAFTMYGSLATIIIIMVWIYVCMTLFLFGGVINVYFIDLKSRLKKEKNIKSSEKDHGVEITDDPFDN